MTDKELAALKRLMKVAQGDTHQSRHVADFLLAWWNDRKCGGIAVNIGWGCDDGISDDMVTIFGYVSRNRVYPSSIAPELDGEFRQLVKDWRPNLG